MASLFRPARELLTLYATYHRDRRNIATHFVGIPLIVFAVAVLMSRGRFALGGWEWAPIHVALLLTTLWYLSRGEFVLGLATSAVNGLLTLLALPLGNLPQTEWLGWGLGLFVLGWVIQFIGHKFEGRKPAFVDDLVGLLVGPMFVVMEALFAMGWGQELKEAIEGQAGPTRNGASRA